MGTPDDKWEAEDLFVREGKTLREICALLKVGHDTMDRWSRAGGWVAKRRERQAVSPRVGLETLLRQRDLLIAEMPPDKLASPEQIESLTKLNAMIEKMEARLDAVGPMLDLFGRFAHFVASRAERTQCLVVRDWIRKFLDEERRRTPELERGARTMDDIAAQLEARRRISACEQDMRRASERVSDAARHISRAIVAYTNPLDFDAAVIDAAVADVREARQAYLAALRKKNELKAALGEE